MFSLQVVISKTVCEVPNSRFTLCFYILFIVLHFISCFIRVPHFPNYYGTDLNRVSHLIIYFKRLSLEVFGTQADLMGTVEGIHKEKAVIFHAACILAKKNQY